MEPLYQKDVTEVHAVLLLACADSKDIEEKLIDVSQHMTVRSCRLRYDPLSLAAIEGDGNIAVALQGRLEWAHETSPLTKPKLDWKAGILGRQRVAKCRIQDQEIPRLARRFRFRLYRPGRAPVG